MKNGNNSKELGTNERGHVFLKSPVRNSQNKLSPKEVILSLLRAKAMKQVDLADEIGMSRQGLNAYISGKWEVPTQIKIKIAQALEVDSSVIWDLEKNV